MSVGEVLSKLIEIIQTVEKENKQSDEEVSL